VCARPRLRPHRNCATRVAQSSFVTGEGSPYENGRPHAPDRSRHIALKKPCHLPLKVTAIVQLALRSRCLTSKELGHTIMRRSSRVGSISGDGSACGTGDLPNSPVMTVPLTAVSHRPTVQNLCTKPVLRHASCRGVAAVRPVAIKRPLHPGGYTEISFVRSTLRRNALCVDR